MILFAGVTSYKSSLLSFFELVKGKEYPRGLLPGNAD